MDGIVHIFPDRKGRGLHLPTPFPGEVNGCDEKVVFRPKNGKALVVTKNFSLILFDTLRSEDTEILE